MPLIDKNAIEFSDSAELKLFPLVDLPESLSALVGVVLPPEADVKVLESQIEKLAVIAIEFPKFRDGRGFTLARTLRQRGYKADLRAVGHFLPDQFLALLACGFSSFLTPKEHKPEQFAAALAKPHQPGQLLRRSLPRALETT